MMDNQTYSFRTALNGFRREDVVSYLFRLNQKFEAQLEEKEESIRRLSRDNERLQEALKQQLKHAKTVAAASRPDAPKQEVTPETKPNPELAEKELAAYRRAEQYERETRQWSEKIYAEILTDLNQTGSSLLQKQSEVQALAQVLEKQAAQLATLAAEIETHMETGKNQGRQ